MKVMIKHYPLSFICLVVIWILSLMPIFPETGLENVPFIDKWTHFVMYGGFTVILWIEYTRRHKIIKTHSLLYLLLFPLLTGGLLELLQAYCTFGMRSGEWLDFAADAVGVLLGAIVGVFLSKILLPRV